MTSSQGLAAGRRRRAPAYQPVLAQPVLRRLLPAFAASAVGDGMSAVAIAWLVIRRMMTNCVGSGSTVLFSSHVMELAEQVCDHVSIIGQGQMVTTGTTEQVRAVRPCNGRSSSIPRRVGAMSGGYPAVA
jgi:ABC-type cobalamin transport system ATPase subunit